MNTLEVITLLLSMASFSLAIIAIWLALYHKKERVIVKSWG